MASAGAAVDTCHGEQDRSCQRPATLFTSLIHTWPNTLFAYLLRWQTTKRSLAFQFCFFIFLFSFFFFDVCLRLRRDCNGHLLLSRRFGIRPCKTQAGQLATQIDTCGSLNPCSGGVLESRFMNIVNSLMNLMGPAIPIRPYTGIRMNLRLEGFPTTVFFSPKKKKKKCACARTVCAYRNHHFYPKSSHLIYGTSIMSLLWV